MPKYPTVSILLAVRNQKQYVQKAIDSVLAQSSDDWELIIVDDGSEDGTRDVLRQYTDPRIRTYRLSNSRGKARCLNEALARSSGRFLLELDGDDWLEPTAVEEILRLVDDWPQDAACIYGNVRTHIQRGDKAIPLFVQKGRPYKDKFDFLLNCDFFAPRIWKRSAVESVGGWPDADGTFHEGRVREAHGLAIRLLAHYQIVYRDFTVYNYRKHPESLSARYGRRHAWPTKKQDIITALKLWQAPYTPLFDDFLHLIFLRPVSTAEPFKEEKPQDAEKGETSVDVSPFQTTNETQRQETSSRKTAASSDLPAKQRVIEPIIIDTTKEIASKKPLGPEPQLIDVSDSGKTTSSKQAGTESTVTETTPSSGIIRPTAIHIPGFPGSNLTAGTREVARPQAVHWLRKSSSSVREPVPRANPVTSHINETKFFCPIGSTTTGGEQEALHTKFADLLCQYLARELGGTALPVTITLRETQTGSPYGGTYVESPAYIQEQITSLLQSQLPANEPLLILVPGLSNNRTVHLLRSSVPDLIDTSVVVINPGDTLREAGITEVSQQHQTDWLKLAVAFLEHSLGLSETAPETDVSEYFARLVERVRTETKLALRRKQLKG